VTGAPEERAVDHDLGATAYRRNDLRQDMHRTTAVIELAAAMVGDIDPVDSVIDRDLRVFRGRDPLDDQGYLELVLDHFHGAPVQALLEVAAGRTQTAFADIALGDVALAPAVMGGVDGQAERAIAVLDRAADAVLDEGVIAAHVELIHPQRVRCGFGDLFQARLRDRAQHMRGAERARGPGNAGARTRIENL